MAPIAAAVPGTNKELLVVAIGAGSLIAAHVNDGGFWLVKEYLNMSVPQTLATWTVLETIVVGRRPCRRAAPGDGRRLMLIVDAHLDLAMNALEWNRDLTRPIDEIRARERR